MTIKGGISFLGIEIFSMKKINGIDCCLKGCLWSRKNRTAPLFSTPGGNTKGHGDSRTLGLGYHWLRWQNLHLIIFPVFSLVGAAPGASDLAKIYL